MNRIDRIYQLHRLLANRRTPISREAIEEKMECSRSTVTRVIQEMRLYFNAPIKYDFDRNGYHYKTGDNPEYELPGLWFSAEEIHALLTSHNLLTQVQPGLLDPYINPLIDRLNKILSGRHGSGEDLARRIRIIQSAPRTVELELFRKVADAVLARKRLKVLYHGRERDETTERWLSPQRLVYYRDNWYLDAWCHLRRGLRSFSLDRMHVVYAGEKAREVAESALDDHFSSSYGIFAGRPAQTALIRFSAGAARWVADEHWHSGQQMQVLKDGRCEVSVPYSDHRELIMDILKFGADAEVLKPKALRDAVQRALAGALEHYRARSKTMKVPTSKQQRRGRR